MILPKVKDIESVLMHPGQLLSVKENTTVAEAAKKLTEFNIGCLVVFNESDEFTGVISERDIIAKVTTTHVEPQNFLVKQIMTPNPISCDPETAIDTVEQLMARHRIRHLPIVENDRPIGMISSRDIINSQMENNTAMKSAAEDLALLSTELKSLSLKDVVSLAIEEVPRTFAAEKAVLVMPQKDSANLVIYRKDCGISRGNLLLPERLERFRTHGTIHSCDICKNCKAAGGKSPKLVIGLDIEEVIAERKNTNNNENAAFLCMCSFNKTSGFPESMRQYKASLIQEILSSNLTNAQLHHNYQKVRNESEKDPLTEVNSRRVLDQVLKTEHARALRYHCRFSVAIVDVDNFKEINDTAGHAAGDKALRKVAKAMLDNARLTDVVVIRYGGDEFVLLMPETGLNEATVLLERLRRQIRQISIPKVPEITISCGVAEWSGQPQENAKGVLDRADGALYQAKNAGRNRVFPDRSKADSFAM